MLREFMTKVWNEQRKDLVDKFVHDKYKIHLDTGDPWEGQILLTKNLRKDWIFRFILFLI